MSAPLLTAALAGLLSGDPFPDELDVLRTGGVRPRVNLLLDSSCSMGWGARTTNCTWFGNAHNSGSTSLNKNEQMRAVLVGCQAEGDGILDKWADRVEFSVHDFRGVRAAFGSSLASLRSAALGIPARGGTPLSRTLDRGGEYLDRTADASTESCTPFFQLLLSDGNPNGGSATFRQECTPPVESRRVGSQEPWEGSEYLFDRHPDVLCDMPGEQQVRTYTLGFGAPGDFNPMFLQRIAEDGGGGYFYASSVGQLVGAFDAIMSTVAVAGQPLAQISVGRDLFYSANHAYTVAYEPNIQGPWNGNIRKFCIFPPLELDGSYDTSEESCLFASSDGQLLVTNPGVRDQWTGLPADRTQSGGAGEVLRARLGTEPVAPYWDERNIVTWKRGGAAWIPVRPDTWTADDAAVNGCERLRLINFLHGYTWDADCDTGAPVAVREWPLADAVHAVPLELRYAGGETLVLLPTNDGLLHVFDAETGEEKSAIVPAELWASRGVARSLLAELPDQPSSQYTHRYYVDGALQLHHVDDDGDGAIDPGETARVIFSLGRGGRALHVLDVSKMSDGIVDARVRVQSITPSATNGLGNMADTWAEPVVAEMIVAGGLHRAGVFVSGHEPLFDVVSRNPGGSLGGIRFLDEEPQPEVRSLDCAGGGGFADQNGYGPSGLCGDYHEAGCAGTPADPCYDGVGIPLDEVTVPLTVDDGVHRPAALRFSFSDFDLGPGDVLRVEDGAGQLVAEYTGTELDGQWSAWVYGDSAHLRLVTDGNDGPHPGFRIDRVEWEVGAPLALLDPSSLPAPVPGVDHQPALWVMDLDLLGAGPSFGGLDDDGPILLKVARDCTELGDRCLDASRAPDLDHLICPISGAPSPFVRDGRLTALYFGDECGQLFKVYTQDGGQSWTARRLVSLNRGVKAVTKDHRKIFRRIDVVDSLCPGEEVVGLYFGTGNVQRPLATDELSDPAATDGRDVVGVIWDRPSLPEGVTQDDFADATLVDAIDPEAAFKDGKVGWLLRLDPHERMLRDPVVVDGVAYFKTFEPSTSASACEAGTGIDRIYAVDNCSAQAVDGDQEREDRVVWSGTTGIGADLLLVAPKKGVPMVTHGDITESSRADLGRERSRRPGLYLFREAP